eukprot:CAMPEP_0171904130 /NCGR_PEP_ID=MMETSP0993-20121228/3868_1 /TAXON_ID=483369 /ORGANISM="non described non described, Strain CCMP2098" /LENGTH=52 /DNA_ID=CAMNT_0012534899 /DNA_START=129 /DNA_END=287 /DNA_ORIENTATION=-
MTFPREDGFEAASVATAIEAAAMKERCPLPLWERAKGYVLARKPYGTSYINK